MTEEEEDKLKAKKIDKAIRLAIGSLKSHLYYTHDGELVRGEDQKFHRKCVQEYATLIKLLSELY